MKVETTEFLKKNSRAKDCLVSYIANDYIAYVVDKQTSKAMWESLQGSFAKKSSINQLLLRKTLVRSLHDGDCVTTHLLEFEGIIRQLN